MRFRANLNIFNVLAQLSPSQFARTSYSLLGYVLPGILILFLLIIDHDTSILYEGGKTKLLSETILIEFKELSEIPFSFTEIVLFSILILFSYVIGLFVSGLSSLIIERIIVKGTLNFPSENLFKSNKNELRGIFKNYRKPLDKNLQKRLLKILKKRSGLKNISRIDYYWMTHTIIFKEYSDIQSRIDHWVTLYGLNRNLSMSIILYVVLKHLIFWTHPGVELVEFSNLVSLTYIILAAALFWNYLKLFKRNAIDLFMNLLILGDKSSKANHTEF